VGIIISHFSEAITTCHISLSSLSTSLSSITTLNNNWGKRNGIKQVTLAGNLHCFYCCNIEGKLENETKKIVAPTLYFELVLTGSILSVDGLVRRSTTFSKVSKSDSC